MKIRQTHYHDEILKPLLGLSEELQNTAYLALFKYGTFGILPKFNDEMLAMWWQMAKGTIDRLNSRRWTGNKGGRPSSNFPLDNHNNNPIENNLTETQRKPNNNRPLTQREPTPNLTETQAKPPVPVPVPVIDTLPSANADGDKSQSVGQYFEAKGITLGSKRKGGAVYSWQDKAKRYADALGITLKGKFKWLNKKTGKQEEKDLASTWFSLFSPKNRNKYPDGVKNLELAYGFFIDHPRFGEYPTSEKMCRLLFIFHHGLEAYKNRKDTT
jgi:hypothetical protein